MPVPPKTAADDDEPPEITPEASLAADDPTAVWDADALREAGLDLDGAASEAEEPATPPATRGDAGAPPSIVTPLSASDIEVDEDATEAWDESPLPPNLTAERSAAPQPAAGSGWGSTLALALVLGTAVYFAVRFLR